MDSACIFSYSSREEMCGFGQFGCDFGTYVCSAMARSSFVAWETFCVGDEKDIGGSRCSLLLHWGTRVAIMRKNEIRPRRITTGGPFTLSYNYPSTTSEYAFDLCFASNQNPSGAGPKCGIRFVKRIQSSTWLLDINVSNSSLPRYTGGLSLIFCGNTSRIPAGM
jgi:hypothetical protein